MKSIDDDHPLSKLTSEEIRLAGADPLTAEGHAILDRISGKPYGSLDEMFADDSFLYGQDLQDAFEKRQQQDDPEDDPETSLGLDADTLELAAELTGGHWVTIDGAHVYVKDGMVVAGGGKGMKGRVLHKAGMTKSEHLGEARNHLKARAEATDAKGFNNHAAMTQYHLEASKTAPDHTPAATEAPKIEPAKPSGEVSKANRDTHDALDYQRKGSLADAAQSHAVADKAEKSGDKSGAEHHRQIARSHESDAAGYALQQSALKSGDTTAPKTQSAAPAGGEMKDGPHASGTAPTDEEISKAVDESKSGTHHGALSSVHDVRKKIAERNGAKFAGEHLDKRLKSLRGDKVDLVSSFDPASLSGAERAAAVKSGGENFTHVKVRGK
jgi:hypothetical protein